MKKIFFLLIAFALFTGCDRDEDAVALTPATAAKGVAKFEIVNDNSKVKEGQNMVVRNTSKNAVAYRWDFGTGAISTEREPAYLFPSCGSYTVTLTIRDKNGHTEAATKTVNVQCTKPAHNLDNPGTRSRN